MYDLAWGALFKDGSQLFQYSQDTESQEVKETAFKEVLDRKDDLVSFYLANRFTKIYYEVDLQQGLIKIAPEEIPFLAAREDMLRKGDTKYRLIYFREVTRNFGTQLQEIGEPEIVYFLGFQYTDDEGHNHKRLMRIHADGRLVVN